MWESSGSMRSASAPEMLGAKAESAEDLDPNLIPTQLLQEELKDLPYCSFALLHVMVRHLKTIIDHSDKNLMNVTNLAVVFSPCLRVNRAVFIALLTRGDALWKGLEHEGQRPDFSTIEGPADFVHLHTTNTNTNNRHHDSDDGSKPNGYYYDAHSSSSMSTAVTAGQTSNHGALADFDFSPNYSPRRAKSPALSNSTNNDKGSVRSDESVSTARSSEAASVTSYSYEGRTSALDDPEVKTSARDRMRFLSSRLTIDTEKSNRLGRDKRTQSARTPRTLFLRSSAHTPTQPESQPRSASVATRE
uniref:ARAD1C32032p n=1 Tax=Blastobotrys adeninivorans TaxID=409370 RepID=A0A060T2W4_BLAAD